MTTSLRIAHTGAQHGASRVRVRVLKPGVHPPEDLSVTAEHLLGEGEALAITLTPGAVITIDEPADYVAALQRFRDRTPPHHPSPALAAAAETE
jgi:hypothetical protein